MNKEKGGDIGLTILASPIVALKSVARVTKRWSFWRVAFAAEIPCPNCGAAISLVGIWRCGCGYTYRGHVLRECAVCGSLPRIVRCYACDVTRKLPQR